MYDISLPFFGMMLLTALVWLFMYYKRLSWIFGNNIDAKAIDSPEKMAALTPADVANPSNNLKNLFELPIIFYACCIYIMHIQINDLFLIACAYTFFIFRFLHSFVQCTTNAISLRFPLYVIASLSLWAIVIKLAIRLVNS